MTPLSSKMQNTVTNSCNTSTPLTHTSSLPRRLLTIRTPSLFWTLWSYQDLTDFLLLLPIVYMKSTHTEQYLQWDSHYSLSAKYSVFNTLTHTGPKLLLKEEVHINKALSGCNYPTWVPERLNTRHNLKQSGTQS